MTGQQFLQMRRLSARSWLVRLDCLLSSCWSLHFCVPFIGFQILLFFIFPTFSCQARLLRQVFPFTARFEMRCLVCLHVSKISLRILRNFVQALETLITAVLFFDSFPSSFPQASISEVILLTQAYKSRLVVSAGCTRANTISQAKIYRPECLAQVALYSAERVNCTFSNDEHLASQDLYRLKVTDMWAALLSETYCQRLSETPRN